MDLHFDYFQTVAITTDFYGTAWEYAFTADTDSVLNIDFQTNGYAWYGSLTPTFRVMVDGDGWEYSGAGAASFPLAGGTQHAIAIQAVTPNLTGTATSATYLNEYFQIAWNLEPVPEPTFLSLFALGIPLLRRQRIS